MPVKLGAAKVKAENLANERIYRELEESVWIDRVQYYVASLVQEEC